MVRSLPEEKVFKDPVHKYIYVQDRTIWDLINTEEFQRLRRIRQLGTTYLTFHGAEHSRFSHSLGVYEITRKIISQFERHGYPDWPKEEKLLVLCAALLHDLGHGPFSHSMEQLFGVRHEDWTCRLLEEETGVNRVLRSVADDFPQRVASVIRKAYPKPIVINLVSSQLDADRMDYLLRDAYYTGVNYGTFDLERILRLIRPHRGKIVVKESGMHAVEDYLMSRYQMYWQVYFHPVTRSSEIILRQIFRRAKHLFDQSYPFAFLPEPLPSLFCGRLTVRQFVELDESFMQMAFAQWAKERDPVLSDLCGRFLHRRLFKYVAVNDPEEEWVSELKTRFAEAGVDPQYYVEVDFPSNLPYDVYRPGETGEMPPVLLLLDDGNVSEISEKSEIVKSISGLRHGRHHVYYPEDKIRDIAERLDPAILARLYGQYNNRS
jgi:hypothetical protein